MAILEPRYSMEEFARRGHEIYERDIRPRLGAKDHGKFVAIDIETGMWEIDMDDIAASDRLLNRNPTAQMWLERAGHASAYKIGHRVCSGEGL
jgi:hypothetical protein